ncbi:acyltransferase [Chitinispirillales bacterium ANBcel5]|uniref:acyltransferase n=1 Tax=Cellulosispirillum alkaliphilum TaxID=3039283 RepID=UPI002A559D99|nr:acyltransferase [Chitinispirillales bacterium ANBcel5]
MNQMIQRFFRKLAYISPGGSTLRPQLHRMRGVTIGKNVWISQYVYIDEIHPEVITIEDNCTIGLHTTLVSHFYWGPRRSSQFAGPIHIEEDVFIGPHCVILPKVKIGKGSVIQAGTVVSKDVPPNTLWGVAKAGPLARVTNPLTAEVGYDSFLKGLRPLQAQKVLHKNS